MSSSDINSQQLSGGERLAVTWALIWPYVLLEALMVESAHIAAPLGVAAGNFLLAAMILDLFVVFPWAVRRALGLRYSGFQFGIVRRGGEAGDRMSYGVSLSVAWLLMWRAAVIIGLFHAAWKSFGGSDWLSHVSLSTDLLVWLVRAPIEGGLYFWLLGVALRKQYRKFSIRIHRTGVVTPRFSPFVRGVAR